MKNNKKQAGAERNKGVKVSKEKNNEVRRGNPLSLWQ